MTNLALEIPEFVGICWPLEETRPNSYGYGRFYWHQRSHPLHRVVYRVLRGPIPDGYEIDHLCRIRNCQNPWHMEPVPKRVNTLRGVSPSALMAAKTHCANGHPLEFLWGQRRCRICFNEGQRMRYAAKKWKEEMKRDG